MILHTVLYLDPGTGSLVYQALLSGILSISIFFGSIKAYVKNKIK